jgi:predicted TIM-barrel fold metal-dependent hydrolase
MNAFTQGAIDCDIHPGVPGIKTLLPYMDDHWRDAFILRGMDNFDLASYPPGAPISCRPDWRPPQGKPGTLLPLMQSQALDHFGTRFAICNTLYGGQAAVSETMGAAMCTAINDWIEAEWLARDARLCSSIVVPAQSPELSVAEIERKAGNKRFVQVLMPAAAEILYGKRYYWPVYEIAQHYDLPIGLHAGSMYRHALTPNGWPSYYLQDYVSQSQVFEDQLLSLVSQGVFEQFPKLCVVLIESGVTWLPHFLWRAIKTWHGVRAEAPWVKRSPADYIRDHIRMTIQPIDAPDAEAVEKIIEEIGDDRMLLFATDYPHWQFEGDAVLPPGIPPALVRRIMVDNPLETYPRLKESVA